MMNKVANKFPVHLQGNKETSRPDNGIIWPIETDRTQPNRRMMADIDNGPATIVYNTLQNSTICHSVTNTSEHGAPVPGY